MSNIIFHITTKDLWSQARSNGIYEHPSLTNEGFIHASYAEQVDETLQKHFIGHQNLLLLKLDRLLIDAEIKDEDLYDSGQKFPHIYGPIKLAAILEVKDL